MKMSPENYEKIRKAIEISGLDNEAIRADYRRKGLSHVRMQWDIFRAARVDGNTTTFICDVLYPSGLNDEHIQTALNRIIKGTK